MRRAWWGLCALALTSMAACRSSASAPSAAIPARSCALVVWHRPASDAAHVELVGDWDGWARPGRSLGAVDGYPGWRVASLDLAPGEHEYAIVEDGAWLVDPTVPTTAFHDGQEVSWLDIGDCRAPALRVDDAAGSVDGHATVRATFLASSTHDAIDPATLVVTARDGSSVTPSHVDTSPVQGTLALAFADLAPGKHVLAIHAKDVKGRDAEPAFATAWIEPRPFDPRDMVLYQVIVDRYRGPGGVPLASPAMASDRAGGTLDGVRAAVESGELASLGVNGLWLSPLYANPAGDYPGLDGHPYSSYHGYWPIAPRAIEPRLGGEADVDALVASAHARGMRILFDVVPNHVHRDHPYAQQHLHDGWFNNVDGTCVCGTGACADWGVHGLDCWFTSYLPDLDWRNPDVARQVTSDVVWWLDRFDGDGVRIDAVPMMPRAATRRIVDAIRSKYRPSHSTFLLGENFVGENGYEILRYELGPYGLDSEFHFPLMWSLRAAIADESAPMSDVDATIEAGIRAWSGSGAVMTTMIGNHDVVRFATESAGEGGASGWIPAAQPADGSEVYAKQLLALGTVLTVPGSPVLYYGDELALVGHTDPDSRHVMPAESALLASQRRTRDAVRKLGAARACSDSLRRGSYRLLFADAEHLAYARELEGADPAVVLLFRRASTFSAPLPGIASGTWVEVLGEREASLSHELTNIGGAPLSLQLLFPKGSACAHPAAQ